MTEKVTIVITTYKRPEKLKECIGSIEKYTNPDNYRFLFMVDNADRETYKFLNEKNHPAILLNKQKDWVGLTNSAIAFCETEHFLFICDDWLAVEDGWLEKGMKKFKEKFPDGMGLLIFNDFLQEEYSSIIHPIKLKDGSKIPMATHGLSTKSFAQCFETGNLLYPGYKHYSADCELAIRAYLMRKFYYYKDVVLKHNHHIHTGERDEVYNESERLNFQRDLMLFQMRNKGYLA